MQLCAAVTGCYLGWVVLAVFPRGVVRLSWRIAQDLLVLSVCSLLLPLVCVEPLACLLVAVVACVMYNDLPSPWMGIKQRAVVITGCDQGMGHSLALRLDKMGFQVFAACLFHGQEGEQALVSQASDRLTTFQMDVTNIEQVEAGAKLVAAKLDGKELHGVVNNAGVLLLGNMEVMASQDIRKILEVNCLGLINVYRAFMPLLRRPRRGGSRMVNVASNIGLAPAACMGAYAASKAAVATLSETWRYEYRPLGVTVSTIIPSGYKTGIMLYDRQATGDRWWNQANQEVKDYFGKECFVVSNKVENHREYLNADFSHITMCMLDALLTTHPRPFYYKGLLARTVPFLYFHLPSFAWDKVKPFIADYYKLPVAALRRENEKVAATANGSSKED